MRCLDRADARRLLAGRKVLLTGDSTLHETFNELCDFIGAFVCGQPSNHSTPVMPSTFMPARRRDPEHGVPAGRRQLQPGLRDARVPGWHGSRRGDTSLRVKDPLIPIRTNCVEFEPAVLPYLRMVYGMSQHTPAVLIFTGLSVGQRSVSSLRTTSRPAPKACARSRGASTTGSTPTTTTTARPASSNSTTW